MKLAELQNTLGGVPDLLLRDGLLVDGQQSPLGRDAYLARLAFYGDERLITERRFFAGLPVKAPGHAIARRRAYHDGEELLYKWPSGYEALNPALAADVASYVNNRDAYLFHWRHAGGAPRPLVLCVHGFQMGEPKRAMALFRTEKLYQSGLDVALFVQPHHGLRAHPRDNAFRQHFINPHDVPLTIENLRQMVHDLRAAYLLLEAQGYTKIGLIGASLGGYACALYAAADASPACAFTAVPALRLNRTLVPRPWKFRFPVDAELARATERALEIAAPVNYAPRLAASDIAVVYHAGDRIADVEYTREWIAGWRIPNVTVLQGGHWAVFDGKARGRAWYAWLTHYAFFTAPERSSR
jgi:pimeloyl-ACP methyl ester carboxylesterase